jgi:hypothetical protein
LAANKNAIEETFGESLDWQLLEDKRACRICNKITLGGYRDDEEQWPKVQEAMVDAMMRLDKALRPYINNIKI